MEAEIEVKGLPQLIAKLGRLATFQNLRPAMADGLNKVWGKVADYPVARPESKYVRTLTLGRRWTMKMASNIDGITGVLGNNTLYGPWVQGPTYPDKTTDGKYQARIHQGIWPTAHGVLKDNTVWITKRFDQAIEKLLR